MSLRHFIIVAGEHRDDGELGCCSKEWRGIIRYSRSVGVGSLDISGASCLPLCESEARFLSFIARTARLDWIRNYPMLKHVTSLKYADKMYIIGESAYVRFINLDGNYVEYSRDGTPNRPTVHAERIDFSRVDLKDADVPNDSSLKDWRVSFKSSNDSKEYHVFSDKCVSGERVLQFRSSRLRQRHDVTLDQLLDLCRFDLMKKEISVCFEREQFLDFIERPSCVGGEWKTVKGKKSMRLPKTTLKEKAYTHENDHQQITRPAGRCNLRPAHEPTSPLKQSYHSCNSHSNPTSPDVSRQSKPPQYIPADSREDMSPPDEPCSGHSSLASQSSFNDLDADQTPGKSWNDEHIVQMSGVEPSPHYSEEEFPKLSSTTPPTRDRSMTPPTRDRRADTGIHQSPNDLRSKKEHNLYPSSNGVSTGAYPKEYDSRPYSTSPREDQSGARNGMKVDAGVVGATTLNSPSSGPTASHEYSSSSSPAKLDFVNSGYTPKSGDFCRIHNLERSCTEPHFGTVRAIVTVQSPMKTCIGLELVKSCGCPMTTDGTYSKKSYFKTNSKQALFVPPTFLELLFPKSGEEIPIKELDLVRAVIPMPNHKHKVLDAIVQEMEYDFLILQACQMEEWMFEFNVDTLKVSGKFPNPRNPEKFNIRLPGVFARHLFSPSKVCDGDICEMFVPDFATFQALVQCSDPAGDPKLPTYTIELLDSDLPAGIEFPRGIQLIHGNVYSVKAFYLRSLHQTLDDDHHGEAKRELVLEPIRERQPALASITRDVFGRYKGIQGLHNSCYMDSLFFSLFLFNSNLDNIFEQLPTDSHKQSEVKQTMRELIINPLRKVGKHFVSADHMMKLRNMLEADLPGVSCEEKDAEELLSLLFSRISGMQPLLAIWNDVLGEEQNLFLYQMFVETDEDKATRDQCMPSLHNLLIQSFLENGQTLLNRPDCLLLQLPRFGKEKIFPAIFTPIHLDLLPISQSARRSCVLCDEKAQFSCTDCYKNRKNDKGLKELDGSLGFFYCNDCWDDLHGKRKNHKKRRLDLDSKDRPMRYELQAVLCIRTSHYVCFVRTKDERNQPAWVFFDSMSDRDERSQNVPVVKRCPEFEDQLGQFQAMSESHRNLMLQSIYREKGKEELVRLLADAYICMYKRVDDTESPTPEWAGPETFDHALRAGHSHTHKPSETLV